MIDRTRTIHLGRAGGSLRAIMLRLGIGERHERPSRPEGWFVSPAEKVLLDAERARLKAERHRDREHDAEYRKQSKLRADAARRAHARRNHRAQLVAEWREECAHPAPGREEPKACWLYLLAARGMALDTPMPREVPPRRVVLRAEDYMTRGDGEAVLVRPGTARRPE